MAKKKTGGKKTGGSKKQKKKAAAAAAGSPDETRALVIVSVVLAAAGAVVFLVSEKYPLFTIVKFAGALLTGVLAGVSGNAMMAAVPCEVFSWWGAGAAGFPCGLPGGCVPVEVLVFVTALITGGATMKESLKRGWLRYEVVLIVPALALPGMAVAWWAQHTSPLFNDTISGAINGRVFMGLVLLAISALAVAKWSGMDGRRHHWLWSAAAGPVLGFWVAYTGGFWMYLLVILIFFISVVLLNEDAFGAIAAMPFMLAPLLGAKFLFIHRGGWLDILGNLWECITWEEAAIALAGIAAGRVWAARLVAALPARARRAVFFSTFIIFTVVSLVRLF